MINKRFLNFKTYAEFSRLNEAGEIRQESIVWIADTNQMWTHGTLYSSITEEQARKLAGILTDGAGLKYLTDKLTYEELPDQATVIDIDGKIMDLTTESSNEDILAVFGTLPDFTSLIETIRNSETILNSILVDNDSQVGKVNATILANKTSNTLDVIYFDHVKKTFVQLTITETDSVLSCVREEFGSAGGGDTTPEVSITEAEPVPGSQEKVYYQVVEDNVDLGVDTDAPADGNMYGRKDNAWQKIKEGDPTNVLILNYETDLANGQQSQPIDPSISAKLIDAVDTGKACVIKSGNSDILSNIQKVGTDVHIIMEQISKFEGAFIATNTTITVDTAGNTIKAVDTGAIELIDKSKVLAKDNSTEFTPSGIYQPATKKYVDDSLDTTEASYMTFVIGENTFDLPNGMSMMDYSKKGIVIGTIEGITDDNNKIVLNFEKNTDSGLSDKKYNILNPTGFIKVNGGILHYQVDYTEDQYDKAYMTERTNLKINISWYQRILTETEYSGLGDTPNTDGVLYFVTPDA